MKKLFYVVLCALAGFTSFSDDETAKGTVHEIYSVASSTEYWNLSEKEKSLIETISEFGPSALPYLVELLDDPRKEVRMVSAEAIESIATKLDTVDERYLPPILQEIDRGNSGLPNVLGKIKTPSARFEFMKRYLADSSSPHNQYQNAFRKYGKEFIPYIIESVISDNGKCSELVYLLGYALDQFENEDRGIAATELIKTLERQELSLQKRNTFVLLIGYLGESAQSTEPQLIELWKNDQDLTKSAAQALVGIRSKTSGEILSKALRDHPNHLLLRYIAKVGFAAEDAGKDVAALLKYSDWDIRLGAARTLGFIGYQDANNQLIEFLNDPRDVRLNYVAAESLGRLGAENAVEALKDAATNHWYPAVRNSATIAVEKITNNIPYERKYHPDNFAFEYFDFQHIEIEATPDQKEIEGVQEPPQIKLYSFRDADALVKLSYPSEIIGIDASDAEEQIAEKGDGAIIVVNEENMVEHRRTINQIPEVGLHVHNGWIVGSSRGEWGGELAFIEDGGNQYFILEDNVIDLFQLGDRIVAVTGLAHLMSNRGMVYEVKFRDGKWTGECWRALPGAPMSSGRLESGEIFITTRRAGTLVLSSTGHFRMAY